LSKTVKDALDSLDERFEVVEEGGEGVGEEIEKRGGGRVDEVEEIEGEVRGEGFDGREDRFETREKGSSVR